MKSMPSRPPSLRPTKARAPRAVSNWSAKRASRHQRGYGLAHTRMRETVLREEPICRACIAQGRATPTTVADHITPKAEGGTDDRDNYQGLCSPCHNVKTAAEAARGRKRR